MSSTDLRSVDEQDVLMLGKVMNGEPGKKAREILHRTFAERLSYTRGEPEHTMFLEGQKSVIQFIENAVKAARQRAEE